MRKSYLIGCLVLAGGLVTAQTDEASLRDVMKQIAPANGGLGKKLAAKDASASEDAKKLQGWFVDLHKFFADKNLDDAVQFSDSGAEQYGKVSALAADGKWDEAIAEQKKAFASCSGCHTAHREKSADGTYKLK